MEYLFMLLWMAASIYFFYAVVRTVSAYFTGQKYEHGLRRIGIAFATSIVSLVLIGVFAPPQESQRSVAVQASPSIGSASPGVSAVTNAVPQSVTTGQPAASGAVSPATTKVEASPKVSGESEKGLASQSSSQDCVAANDGQPVKSADAKLATNGADVKPGDKTATNGADVKPGDKTATNGADVKPGDKTATNGADAKPGDKPATKGADAKPGDKPTAKGSQPLPVKSIKRHYASFEELDKAYLAYLGAGENYRSGLNFSDVTIKVLVDRAMEAEKMAKSATTGSEAVDIGSFLNRVDHCYQVATLAETRKALEYLLADFRGNYFSKHPVADLYLADFIYKRLEKDKELQPIASIVWDMLSIIRDIVRMKYNPNYDDQGSIQENLRQIERKLRKLRQTR